MFYFILIKYNNHHLVSRVGSSSRGLFLLGQLTVLVFGQTTFSWWLLGFILKDLVAWRRLGHIDLGKKHGQPGGRRHGFQDVEGTIIDGAL